jgi:hypothetical protein
MALEAQLLVPVVAALGFGIQQFSQVIVDPAASISISLAKKSPTFGEVNPDGTKSLKGGVSDVDAKKILLGLGSVGCGLIVALNATSIRVLAAAGLTNLPILDVFITALTIGAGTEGANSIIKLAQYVKDAVKTKTAPSVAQSSPVPQFPAGRVPAGVTDGEDDREFDA